MRFSYPPLKLRVPVCLKPVVSKFLYLAFLFIPFSVSCVYAQHETPVPTKQPPQQPPKRELRAVWIATVANIDWPSNKDLTADLQKAEFIRILDNLKKNGINCVIVQVRDAADAFYRKSREPWSEWLNGEQGVGPDPSYDPLEFFILEAHKRAMEIHAWVNPYRAVFDTRHSSVEETHITRKNPGWFFTYGTTKLFNPGIPGVRSYIVNVIMDIVRNYDIDGLHMDDYFYPYPEKGQYIADGATFQDFPAGFTNLNDWRRNNVNLLIHTLHDSILAAKPYVKFGISPFGTWKDITQDPAGSHTHGMNSFFDLYADTRLWVQNGWVDYINPQIYFAPNSHAIPFDTLTRWWDKNSFGRHLYIGFGAYKIGIDKGSWRDPALISAEMDITRKYANVQGQVFFSAQSMLADRLGFADTLKNKYYRYPALIPTMNWKDTVAPNPPIALRYSIGHDGIRLNWTASSLARDGDSARYYVVYRFEDNEAVDLENPKHIVKIIYHDTQFTDNFFTYDRNYFYVVTALDRLQNESPGTCNIYVDLKAK